MEPVKQNGFALQCTDVSMQFLSKVKKDGALKEAELLLTASPRRSRPVCGHAGVARRADAALSFMSILQYNLTARSGLGSPCMGCPGPRMPPWEAPELRSCGPRSSSTCSGRSTPRRAGRTVWAFMKHAIRATVRRTIESWLRLLHCQSDASVAHADDGHGVPEKRIVTASTTQAKDLPNPRSSRTASAAWRTTRGRPRRRTRADTVRYMPSTTSRTTRTQRATVWRSRICPRRSKLLDKLPHVANAIETGLDWLRHTSPTRSSSCLAGLAKLFTWSACTLIGGLLIDDAPRGTRPQSLCSGPCR